MVRPGATLAIDELVRHVASRGIARFMWPERLEIVFPTGAIHKIGRKELGIIAYLHNHVGVVITRKELIHSVYGAGYRYDPQDKIVD